MTVRNTRTAGSAAVARWALWLALAFSGLAMAQAEPTLDQVYQAAQAGRVEQALEMMQPVLKAHPGSAKAHFVQAELLARQGLVGQARDQLGQAEKLAPGLPFAKAESVQNLRRELAAPSGATAAERSRAASLTGSAAPAKRSSVPWGVLLALGGGALAAWMLMRLARPAASPAFTSPGPVAAPLDGTGMGVGGPVPGMNTNMPASMGMAPGAPAAPAMTGGLGRQMAGGLATGLAVGAGVMAAESLGRSLFGGHSAAVPEAGRAPAYDPAFGNPSANPDMGGNDFGVSDAGSWDDAGAGGGSDWDT